MSVVSLRNIPGASLAAKYAGEAAGTAARLASAKSETAGTVISTIGKSADVVSGVCKDDQCAAPEAAPADIKNERPAA